MIICKRNCNLSFSWETVDPDLVQRQAEQSHWMHTYQDLALEIALISHHCFSQKDVASINMNSFTLFPYLLPTACLCRHKGFLLHNAVDRL